MNSEEIYREIGQASRGCPIQVQVGDKLYKIDSFTYPIDENNWDTKTPFTIVCNPKPRPDEGQFNGWRSRDDIEHEFEGRDPWESRIILEVLLDIRDLLQPKEQTIERMTSEQFEEWRKAMSVTSPAMTGVFRTPNGDEVTTATTSPTGKYCEDCGSYDHTTEEH